MASDNNSAFTQRPDFSNFPHPDNIQVIQLENFSMEEHLKKMSERLKNNPFVPPVGKTPVNNLPNELLSQIFVIGADLDGMNRPLEEEEEEEPDLESEEEEEPQLAFQVLASHVCRRWREVALQTPSLWSHLDFAEGPPFEKSRTYLERSSGCPLDIEIDCTVPEEEVEEEEEEEEEEESEEEEVVESFEDDAEVIAIDADVDRARAPAPAPAPAPALEEELKPSAALTLSDLATISALILPHVSRWRVFELMTDDYLIMHHTLAALASAPAADTLEELQLYHYDDTDEVEHFEPAELRAPIVPFGGRAPRLTHVALWGVHLDWPGCGFLQGLKDFELAYHAHDVRPLWADFARMLRGSPELLTLTLCMSGPAGVPADWPKETIVLPSVRNLVLAFMEPAYVSAILDRLVFPNVTSLALDFEEDDYSALVAQLAAPQPGKVRSVLAGLEDLRLSGLPASTAAIDTLYGQLGKVTSLHLNCHHLDEEFFKKLFPPTEGAAAFPLPSLVDLSSSGVDGDQIHALVEARKARPVKRVYVEVDDLVEPEDEQWLRQNLEHFAFFEGSDDEEEDMVEIDFAVDAHGNVNIVEEGDNEDEQDEQEEQGDAMEGLNEGATQ